MQFPYPPLAVGDASRLRLGNQGVFDASLSLSTSPTYGGVQTVQQLITDPKDGPVTTTCGVFPAACYGPPVACMAGYESASQDPTVLTCAPSYLSILPSQYIAGPTMGLRESRTF